MPAKPLAAYQSVVNSFRVIRCSSQCVSPKIAIFTIFVSPGDAPGAIALNVVWMEREFDAYKLSRSTCHLSSTVSHIFEPQCKKSPFSRTTSHIFVSPRDAPAIITQYVARMERQFNGCQTPRSMYLSIFNTFRVIRCLSQCASPKIAIFTTFVSPGHAPGPSR